MAGILCVKTEIFEETTMRKAMDRQLRLDGQPIMEVNLNLQCRDEIIPILVALRHLYSQSELRDGILREIAADVNRHSSRKRGRQGTVLGRNLHVLGKVLLAVEDAECPAAQSRRKRIAA